MIALVDCNNFYASCERVFNPAIRNKPVVVLSNNDGCVIARSAESKALGIKMGEPHFMIKEQVKQHGIEVFSSNYTLYGDMSNRVMKTLAEFTPNLEVYSIDESFLDLGHFFGKDLQTYAWEIKNTVLNWTGIPVGVGVAKTKTLAKIANRLAKKSSKANGVLVLQEPEHVKAALERTEVEDIWGIGKQNARLLKHHNINTAYDLTQQNDSWVKKNLTIVGLRLVKELRGEPCLQLEEVDPPKKNICTSRSFGTPVKSLCGLEEATALYAAKCAYKLRQQGSCASAITVFITTNTFANTKQYYNSRTIQVPTPINSDLHLIHYASIVLKSIYVEGYIYKKCGVIVSGLVPENTMQLGLFDGADTGKHRDLMHALDGLNKKYGQAMVKSAAQGSSKAEWLLKREYISPCYTTKLSDVPVARL
ncbi:Y-family DNA polymerase [Pontibacter cellulosilyticus]|uniref:Y-family DNA polymerase n=1 Tax=Pontibacter cellulosilyticus TaxID=1720253 RepID=A0A923NBH1_9BACT|nr:Y-family DNA polymerase [Pontibacter cellulosilyticus]MBC5994367.1 Y-family DNA polymerase [Pontibacter cellulosilyticus]